MAGETNSAAYQAVLGSGKLMTRRYLLALGVVAILSISAFVSLQWVIAAQEASATIVNISGRQRMLSQRTALFSLRLVQGTSPADRSAIRATLREAATKMRVSHNGLTLGDAAMGLPARMSEVVRQRYFEPPLLVDRQVRTYLDHVFALLGKADEELRDDDPDLLYIMNEAPRRLLTSLDGLVKQYESESKAEVTRLERVEILVLALTLFMLVLEARFIFRPMVRRVGEETLKLLEVQHQLEHLAHHDPLTGLLNRTMFAERVGMALARDRREQRFTAILCLDLDHFKDVNDTLGHSAGDELLKVVAARFGGCIREVDHLTRLGGDEFAIVQTGLKNPADAEALSKRLLACVEKPFPIEGQNVFVGLSIGASVAPLDGDDPACLLRQADIALYRAKADGRGVYRFFESEMDGKLRARKSLEADLRRALGNGELIIYYQPRIDSQTGRLIGVEALVRWRHPERGLVSPCEFIPLAEETGLILPLGEWCLRTACAQVAAWGGVELSVNLSPVQFKHNDLVGLVRDTLRESGLDPLRLELEITEGVLIQDSEGALAILTALRELGVRIAMDDFGTGYSSLGYLQRFPVDKIKIDRSFVGRLGCGGNAVAIVKAMVNLGRSLGIGINAEGVETAEQMAILRQLGCDEVQGFLMGKPVAAEEIAQTYGCSVTADAHSRSDAAGAHRLTFVHDWSSEVAHASSKKAATSARFRTV